MIVFYFCNIISNLITTVVQFHLFDVNFISTDVFVNTNNIHSFVWIIDCSMRYMSF